jgi:hypothetical protein
VLEKPHARFFVGPAGGLPAVATRDAPGLPGRPAARVEKPVHPGDVLDEMRIVVILVMLVVEIVHSE